MPKGRMPIRNSDATPNDPMKPNGAREQARAIVGFRGEAGKCAYKT